MRPSEERLIVGAYAGAGAGAGAGATGFDDPPFPDCDLPDEATSEQNAEMLATQDVLLDDMNGIKKQLDELKQTIDQDRRRSLDESSAPGRTAVLEQSAIQKLLEQYAKDLSHKLQDLHYYIRPDVVTELPGNLTVGEYVAEVEGGKREDATKGLLAEVDDYLASDDNILLLLGEPGAGKSLFAWYSTQVRLSQYRQVLQGEDPGVTPWLPVVIELKAYTLSELKERLPRYLEEVCRLTDGELSAIQLDRKPEHKLLVVLDGFDELKQPAAGERDIQKSFADCFTACGAKDWYAGQVKLVVTCRVRHLADRYLERQYFGHGVEQRYRRRILLPFSSAKIAAYLHERVAHVGGASEGALRVADYLEVLGQSKSVKEMVRNPFVLRLFAEALPRLRKDEVALRNISRFCIYQEFVSQWFEREVRRLDLACQRVLGVDKLGIPAVAKSFERYAGILAMEMYRQDTLVVRFEEAEPEDPAFQVWSRLDELVTDADLDTASINARLSEDYRGLTASAKRRLEIKEHVRSEEEYINKHLGHTIEDTLDRLLAQLEVFKTTSPLRQSGYNYSFIHKSFYEYFIAKSIIGLASSTKPLEARVLEALAGLAARPGRESRRLWHEPEALDFVCEYWTQASREQKDRLKETLFGVIEATKGYPKHGVAGANAGTLLNWVNVSLTGVNWQGVHLPGIDLRQAYLEGSELQKADLTGARLGQIKATNVNLCKATLTHVEFNERPAFMLEQEPKTLVFNPKRNVVGVAAGSYIYQFSFMEGFKCELSFYSSTGSVDSISYSPDGKWLASCGGDNAVQQWNTEVSDARRDPFNGHTSKVRYVSYSADGKWLASCGDDDTVLQWNAETGERRCDPIHDLSSRISCLSYSSDGKWLAGGSRCGNIHQWKAFSGEEQRLPWKGHAGEVLSLSYSCNGLLASSGKDGGIKLWVAESGDPVGGPLVGHESFVQSINFNSDGSLLVSGGWDKTIRQWDVMSGASRGAPLVGHSGIVQSVCYTEDSQWVLSVSRDKTIRKWNASSEVRRGARVSGHKARVTCLCLSSDSVWVASGGRDRAVLQWELSSGRPRYAPLIGHKRYITCVSYSKDGEWIAGGADDGTILQWGVSSRELLNRIKAHESAVKRIQSSADSRYLFSWDNRNEAKCWDSSSGVQVNSSDDSDIRIEASKSDAGSECFIELGGGSLAIKQWFSENKLPSSIYAGFLITSNIYSGNLLTCAKLLKANRTLVCGTLDGIVQVWQRFEGDPRAADSEEEVTSKAGTGGWFFVWGCKSYQMQLSVNGMKLTGATGLEPHQLELLRQHGYEGGGNLEGDVIAAGAEESKTVPPEETETEVEVGLGAGQQVTRAGLFAEPPRGVTATSGAGGVEESKQPDSDTELTTGTSAV